MTIAISIPNFSGGGAELVTVRLANGLAAMGRDVRIVVNQETGIFRDKVAAGVRVVDLGAARTVTALPRLAAYLRRERPAILLSGLLPNNVNALLAGRLGGWRGRLVVGQHNTFTVEAAQSAKNAALSWALARLIGGADAVVAVSGGVADDLARRTGLPRSRIEVVHNPIVTPDFDALAGADPAHAWMVPGLAPVFVAVGRLAPQKDYPTLLRALAIARRSVPARLVILGEGDLLAELAATARDLGVADAVDFAGFRPNPLAFISRATALVLTSSFEGFGNVVAEALACGTPVISTACNGPVEILEGGRVGTLVAVGDHDEVARAMVEAARAVNVDRAALRGSADRFRTERVAARYAEIFDALA